MELILTTEQRSFLANVLEQRHRELLKEISHTDNRQFRQVLRNNEKMIEDLLGQLRPVVTEAVGA